MSIKSVSLMLTASILSISLACASEEEKNKETNLSQNKKIEVKEEIKNPDLKKDIQNLVNDQKNYKVEGGINLFGSIVGGTKKLDGTKLEELIESVIYTGKQQKTLVDILGEKSDKVLELEKKIKEIEDKLFMDKLSIEDLKRKNMDLLISQNNAKQLQEMREKVHKEETENQKRLLEDLRIQKEELSECLEKKELLEKNLTEELKKLEGLKDLDGNDISTNETIERIKKLILSQKEQIEKLTKKVEEFELNSKKSEKNIEELKKEINKNNHYEIIKEMALNKYVSDDDLMLKIFLICQNTGLNLDQLSEGKEQKLTEIIINVSRPLTSRPYHVNSLTFSGCWRLIGNSLLKKGESLAWEGGMPIDFKKLKVTESSFAEKTPTIVNLIKKKFSE